MKQFLLSLWLPFSIPSFAQDTAVHTEVRTYTEISDLPYRTGEQTPYMKERCKLDVYYPARANRLPVIVWFHGGGITGGNKHIPEELKRRQVIIVAANYRFSPKVTAPAYIEDAAAAVAWTFRNIQRYGGDTTKIYVAGHSAGGYLASMIGLDKQWLRKEGIDADKIAALFPFSGQAITHFTVRKEKGIADTRPIIDSLAPLYHVRADAPPLYLYTGDRELEMLGRYEENAYLERMMKLTGHKHTHLYELDGFDHGNMPKPAFYLMLKVINGR